MLLVAGTGNNPTRRLASRLAPAAAEIRVIADLDDRAALRRAVQGCRAVFAMTVADADDPERELARGRNVINAVAASEVDYFVLCASRLELSEYAQRLDLPMTFIHAVAARDPDGVSATGIDAAVAEMFRDPAAFVGRTLTVAF